MFYVVTNIALSCLILLINSQTFDLAIKSRLAVGSSNINTFASPTRAIAIDNNRLAPPESYIAG